MNSESNRSDSEWSPQLDRWRGYDEWPDQIFNTLLRRAPGVCRAYDPGLFSPIRGIWNTDAYRTVVVETMYRLRHGYVENCQYIGRCNAEVCAYTIAIMRSYLESIGRRRGARRRALHQKLRALLQDDPCFAWFSGDSTWGLRGWPGTVAMERVSRQCRTRRERIRDPDTYLPSKRDLKHFVRDLIEARGCSLTFRHIVRAALNYFGVTDVVECPLPTRRDPTNGSEIIEDVPDKQLPNLAEIKVLARNAAQTLVNRICQTSAHRSARRISPGRSTEHLGRRKSQQIEREFGQEED